jgi:hypothetical protein
MIYIYFVAAFIGGYLCAKVVQQMREEEAKKNDLSYEKVEDSS